MPVHVGTVQLDRDLNDKVPVTTDFVLSIIFPGSFLGSVSYVLTGSISRCEGALLEVEVNLRQV